MPVISRSRTVFFLGLPIIIGMLSQSLLNLVDAALVGQLGTSSLAGVGIGGYANFVAVSLILGISSSVQMLVARNAKETDIAKKLLPFIGGVSFSFCIALPLSILLVWLSEWFMVLMNPEPAIQDIAKAYFDWRTSGMLAVALLLTSRGWWYGTHRSSRYLKILLLTHGLNVVISYCLIFGHLGLPRMGAPGAGLGTALALYIGAFINLSCIWRENKVGHHLLVLLKRIQLKRIIQQTLPHSAQQLMLALSLCVLMWIIGKLGTDDQAIAYLLINISLFLILPAVGFGVASTSLVSRALGDEDFSEAYRWGWYVVMVAIASILVLSLPLLLFPELVLSFFIPSPSIIKAAAFLLQLTAVAILIDASAIVLAQALYGANAGKHSFAISTIGQWLFFLPMAWFVGVELNYGLTGIWSVQLVHRAISACLFILIWKQKRWQDNKLQSIT